MHQQNEEAAAMNLPRTPSEIEEIVVMARLYLYNRDLPCGPEAIKKYMADEYATEPLPSDRTIARILNHQGLTNQRTGHYEG
jgi:hypothetical protein